MSTIPDAALSQHIAVLGKTGSGKTWAAKTIVENLLNLGRRVGVVDPTSAWWGLRSSKSGKGPGFPILVLGGDHGDLPLPALGGAAVARLLVEGVNLVADTSALTVGERTRWFIDFAGTLSRLNRTPLHLVIDEAHVFAPQGKVPDPDTGRMLHAANTLASGGRSRGIRLIMITQRPQKLHKDALTSADTLIAMRVLAPHDRLAVEEWIKGCGDMAAGKEVLNTLASLQRGEGWAWYPEGAFLKRMKFPDIETFDSSATPIDGHAIAKPKTAAEIDLRDIKIALADAVKEAEANDPKLLRARIAELERKAQAPVKPAMDAQALDRAKSEGYRAGLDAVAQVTGRLETLSEAIREGIDGFISDLHRLRVARDGHKAAQRPLQEGRDQSPPPGEAAPKRPIRPIHGQNPGSQEIGNSGKRRMLIALAQNASGLSYRKLALLTGISQSGGTWRTYLGELRAKGWAVGSRDNVHITAPGLHALGPYTPLPTGSALIEYWRQRLGNSGKRKIFDCAVEAYPQALTYEQVSEKTEIAIAGGTWRTYLGELRGLELIAGGRGEIRAAEELFS